MDDKEFYQQCLKKYHDTAATMGVANQGLIFIPELLEKGEKTVLSFLNDAFFQAELGDNPTMYYYVINSFCMQAGIIYADQWHENYKHLDEKVEETLRIGPADIVQPILDEHFPEIAHNCGEALGNAIFNNWLELHEPYWALEDPRKYTFYATLASFQLGISMMLDKYGY